MITTCPTCGSPVRPRTRVLCTCGHPLTSHHVTRTGTLTYCCHISGQTGACKCTKFSEDGASR